MRLMLRKDDVLRKKISARIIRNNVPPIKKVDIILDKICHILNAQKPIVLFCDTLTRRMSSFEFQGDRYLVFDNSLIEFLYLYNKLVISDACVEDIDKLYYKILCEECLYQGSSSALVYFKRYRDLRFSFQNEYEDVVNEHITYQVHFLLFHEMTHFDVIDNKYVEEYLGVRKFMLQALYILANNYSAGSYIKDGLIDYFELTIDKKMLDSKDLTISYRAEAFLEECFCDFQAFKQMFKHFINNNTTVSAAYSLIEFLVNSEMIRSSFDKQIITMNTDSDETFFTAFLRLHLFTLIVMYNECDIEQSLLDRCNKINDRYGVVIEENFDYVPTLTISDELRTQIIKFSSEFSIEDK